MYKKRDRSWSAVLHVLGQLYGNSSTWYRDVMGEMTSDDGAAALLLKRVLFVVNASEKRVLVFALVDKSHHLRYTLGYGDTLYLTFHPQLFNYLLLLCDV